MELTDNAQKVKQYVDLGNHPNDAGGNYRIQKEEKGESLKKFNEALIVYKEFKNLWNKISLRCKLCIINPTLKNAKR